jgi:hypothetical protein
MRRGHGVDEEARKRRRINHTETGSRIGSLVVFNHYESRRLI